MNADTIFMSKCTTKEALQNHYKHIYINRAWLCIFEGNITTLKYSHSFLRSHLSSSPRGLFSRRLQYKYSNKPGFVQWFMSSYKYKLYLYIWSREIALLSATGSLCKIRQYNKIEVPTRSQAQPSFPLLSVRKSGRGPGIFSHVSDIRTERMVERA